MNSTNFFQMKSKLQILLEKSYVKLQMTNSTTFKERFLIWLVIKNSKSPCQLKIYFWEDQVLKTRNSYMELLYTQDIKLESWWTLLNQRLNIQRLKFSRTSTSLESSLFYCLFALFHLYTLHYGTMWIETKQTFTCDGI